jgi:glutamate-ammonia-ligase adenylyltransferase
MEKAPVPERAHLALNQLRTAEAADFLSRADDEQARILCALWSGSEWASEMLRQHPDWLSALTSQQLAHTRQSQGLRREVEKWFAPLLAAARYSEALAELRRFKQREMICIAARDLARLASTEEIILEVSHVADVCLNAVLQASLLPHITRFGKPFEEDSAGRWRETTFCVLGLGKLGGQELNYSSDVDVLFVYSDEGSVFKEPPRKGKTAKASLTNHQFFKRVAEQFVAEVGKMTGDGMLYRIDLRLRPEGDAGPLVRSLASYENYYAQWGQTWERMMLIKTRCTAGDATLAGEFLEMTQPFRYPRSLSENVLNEIAATKERIESEVVKSGELDRNVKLGRGGIREIEFVVQALQLLHAGRNPFLQSPQTLPALQKLAQYHLLERAEAEALAVAYSFLRDVEHRLQMEHNQQTHTLPESSAARTRMAKLMGFADFKAFDRERAKHSQRVRVVYERLLQAPAGKNESLLPASFDDGAQWEAVLRQHSFRDPQHAAKLLREFALGPGYGHVSARTTELAMQLIPRLLAVCPRAMERRTPVRRVDKKPERAEQELRAPNQTLSDPDRVVARLDTFVSAYGARATLYEMWSSNPTLFELMLVLFDRSEFLAEVAIRTPDLVDELMLSGHLQKRKSAAVVLEELRLGARDKDQKLWLRRYHQSELMRIGLRDILGLADYEQNFEELSALAEACLQYALEVVMRKHKLKAPPFAIIGWGKLGGAELNYGSDLDITFVAPDRVRELPKQQKLAAELMELLSTPTEFGVAFVTDARLRPDGEKGLLVNTIQANGEYYERRAALWEIQSLTRTRFVAGDAKVGKEFQAMALTLTNFSKRPPVAAFTTDWKARIATMRARIEMERTPPGQDALAIKTGAGGLIDAEFIAQVLCLEHGWHEPNTLAALQRAQRGGALKDNDAQPLIENYRRLRRLEAILRRWSFAGETVLPTELAPLYRVAVRCGFANADEFLAAVAQWRQAIREVYRKVLPAPTAGG